MDPQTRADLARDIHRSTLVGVDELQEVNASIEQAQLSLQELEEKKSFVGVRLAAYQEKLEQREKRLKRDQERLTGVIIDASETVDLHENKAQEETAPLAGLLRDGRSPGVVVNVDDENGDQDDSDASQNDEETGEACVSIEELEKQQMQLRRDQAALEKVAKSHKEMEINARELQKTIFVLERKREEILQKTSECRDFLVAAAHIEHNQEAENDDDTVQSHEDLEEGQSSQEVSTEDELFVLVSERSEELNASAGGEQEEDNKTK